MNDAHPFSRVVFADLNIQGGSVGQDNGDTERNKLYMQLEPRSAYLCWHAILIILSDTRWRFREKLGQIVSLGILIDHWENIHTY